MKRMLPVFVLAAALIGYMAGYASKPGVNREAQSVLTGHFDDLSLIPNANAQESKQEPMPFGYNSPAL